MDTRGCAKVLKIDQIVAAYMKVLRKTENFNALKAIDILSKAPVRKSGASAHYIDNLFMSNIHTSFLTVRIIYWQYWHNSVYILDSWMCF
jgi:hypothetical protein